jgi:hypothetical protein
MLALPILVGVLWGGFEIWQITTLRAKLRVAAAQVARYMTAYAAQPDPIQNPGALQAAQIQQNAEQIARDALAGTYGFAGQQDMDVDVTWYRVLDPASARWDGNVSAIPQNPESVLAFVQSLRCNRIPYSPENNAQFGAQLTISVPWRAVLFGLGEARARSFDLVLQEITMGAVPCVPYGIYELSVDVVQPVPGGCDMVVRWDILASYEIERIEIAVPGESTVRIQSPTVEGQRSIFVPRGTEGILVAIISGDHTVNRTLAVTCQGAQED